MSQRELSIAFQTDKPIEQYAELARVVEGYQFDVLSMYNDLLFQPPIGPLTIAAQATSRIRLGPATLNPFTLHPVEIAGQIATLDLASQGRAYLGIARGAWLQPLGIEQTGAIGKIVEALDVVEHLLAGKRAAYRGKYFQLEPQHALNYAVQREWVPVLIGSWGPKLLRRTSGRASEIKLGGSANPDLVPHVRGWLDGLDQPRIVLGAVTIVDEDRERARQLIRREMPLYLPVIAGLDPSVEVDPELLERIDALVSRGEPEQAGQLIPDDLVDRFAFAGAPADIIAQCQRLFDAGADRIEFGTPHGVTTKEGLRLLGEVVLPALESWHR